MALTMSGKGWTEDEITNLLSEVSESKTRDEIAALHSRSVNSVTFKLKMLSRKLVAEGKTVEEVQVLTGLSENEVNEPLVKAQPKVTRVVKAPRVVKALVAPNVKGQSDLSAVLLQLESIRRQLQSHMAKCKV